MRYSEAGVFYPVYYPSFYGLAQLLTQSPFSDDVPGETGTEKWNNLYQRFALARYANAPTYADGEYGFAESGVSPRNFGWFEWCDAKPRVDWIPPIVRCGADLKGFGTPTVSLWTDPVDTNVGNAKTRQLKLQSYGSECFVALADSSYFVTNPPQILRVRVGSAATVPPGYAVKVGYIRYASFDSLLFQHTPVEIVESVPCTITADTLDTEVAISDFGASTKGLVVVASLVEDPVKKAWGTQRTLDISFSYDFDPDTTWVPNVETTIQRGIDGTDPGNVVGVWARQDGTPYEENVVMRDAVKVVGVPSEYGLPTLHGADTSAAVTYPDTVGGKTILDGFILKGGGDEVVLLQGEGILKNCLVDTTDAGPLVGVRTENTGTESAIQNCLVRVDSGTAMLMDDFSGVVEEDTLVVLGSGLGVDAISGTPAFRECIIDVADSVGIRTDGSVVLAEGCSVTVQNGTGILLTDASGLVDDCSVYVSEGIGVSAGGTVELSGCSVTAAGGEMDDVGIRTTWDEPYVHDCLVSAPGYLGGLGIEIWDRATVERCTIHDVQFGVVNMGHTGTVRGCLVSGSDTFGFYGGEATYCIADGEYGFYPLSVMGDGSVNEDPLLCDGEYTLRVDSYGNPENNAFGQIGAFPVACMYDTLARSSTFTAGTLPALGDVTIPSARTLTLGNQAVIKVPKQDNQSGGSDNTRAEILVEGILEANHAQFISGEATPQKGDWYGIDVKDGGVAHIDTAEVKHGVYGVRFRAGANGRVLGTTFDQNQNLDLEAWGVTSGDTVIVADNTFHVQGARAIELRYDNSGVFLSNNAIVNDATYPEGVLVKYSGSSAPVIEENTITGFDQAQGINIQDGVPEIYRNTITGCKYGILVAKGTPVIGDASGTTVDNVLSDNVTDGLRISGTLAHAVVRHNQFHGNANGIEITPRSGLPDLGTLDDWGNNSITGNTDYCVKNSTGIGVLAEKNWWGQCEAPTCQYGILIAEEWLCDDPYEPQSVMVKMGLISEPSARALGLRAVWPNPGRSVRSIGFHLEGGRATVEAAVFDIAGRLVRSLEPREFPEGDHQLDWDGRNGSGQTVASGVYFVRLRTDKGLHCAAKLLVVR